MGALFTLGGLMVFICFYQACAMIHSPGPNTEYSTSLGSKSVVVYTQKVEPVLAQHCATCHMNRNSPYFMTSNPKLNHDTLTDFRLVSLGMPETSRIVKKIRMGHNDIPIEFADEVQSVIALWAQGVLPSEIMSPFEAKTSILQTQLRRPLGEYIAGAEAGGNALVNATIEKQRLVKLVEKYKQPEPVAEAKQVVVVQKKSIKKKTRKKSRTE